MRGFAVGQELDLGTRQYTLADMRLFNLNKGANHHTDFEEARKIGLKRPLAAGVHYAAFAYEVLTNIYGTNWFYGGLFDTVYTAPVYSGDTLTMKATVTALEGDRLDLDFTMVNQDGTSVLVGKASGRLPSREG
ncbi:MAG: MaoC family dehydratase [Pseudarthrobacter sp.]